MIFEIRMPEFGPGITDGSVSEWKKGLNEKVQPGEPIGEIEVEKAVQDLVSPGEGLLRLVLEAEGTIVPSGTLLAIVAAPGDDISSYQV